MKYLKNYSLFKEAIGINDEITGIGADTGTYDHSNSPVLRLKVQEYVDGLLYSNQSILIFDALGLEQPKDLEGAEMDDMYDQIRDKAIKYFMKNPHKMREPGDIEVQEIGVEGDNVTINTDGIPRVTGD